MSLLQHTWIVLGSLIFCSAINAAPTSSVDGLVHFQGEVVTAACSVSADSSDQVVQMGQVRSNQLTMTGEWIDPTPFKIYLEDCDSIVSQSVGILFTGVSDAKDPQVFKAGSGADSAEGVGIGLFDATGSLVIPNTEPPQYMPLHDGENVLNYIAKYRMTGTSITPGDASAQILFSVLYQ